MVRALRSTLAVVLSSFVLGSVADTLNVHHRVFVPSQTAGVAPAWTKRGIIEVTDGATPSSATFAPLAYGSTDLKTWLVQQLGGGETYPEDALYQVALENDKRPSDWDFQSVKLVRSQPS